MKYKCCKSAISSFMIINNSLSFCHCLTGDKYAFYNNYTGQQDFIEKYLSARKQYIKNCKIKKDIPSICNICAFLQNSDWDEALGIDFINIANRSKCSCNCIYCIATKGNTEKRKELNRRKVYDIKSVLEPLAKNHLLKSSGKLYIEGGDCSEYPASELKYLIKYAKENNFCIEFPSHGMFYSKEIEYALKHNETNLIVSVDAGTKSAYERIKRVKYYDKVWKNLAKYIQAAKNNPNAKVFIKYIIVDKVNDNIEEFKAFLQKCNEVKCENIYITLDHNWMVYNGKVENDNHKNTILLLDYIESLNDSRISTELFKRNVETKTSARLYSQEIAENLLNGRVSLNIITFAGFEQTYKNLTNTDVFNQIWQNIEKYAHFANENTEPDSGIKMHYKLIPGINDSKEEINAFLELCRKYSLNDIEIGLINNKRTEDMKKDDIDRLKNIVNWLKTNQGNYYINFSEKLISITDN